MIVGEIKPFEEIKEMLKDYKKILVVGCGTCMSVCLSGGRKQVELLASSLRKEIEGEGVTVGEYTVARQCEPRFVEQIKDEAYQYEAILSMGCGAGVQGIVERFKDIPVLPALNTKFIGISDGHGKWIEVCAACGDCILAKTGGICPVARCPKSLFNGPCGGSRGGKCEISPSLPCVWHLIIERLSRLGYLHKLNELIPPKNWSISLPKGL